MTLVSLLAELQDRDHDLALLRNAIQAQSITGNEANYVSFLARQMERRGLAPQQKDFCPGRPNLWGLKAGAGQGPRLLFIGHTDTVHVDGWREHWQSDLRADPFGGVEVDNKIWGRGAVDLKGGICAALAAIDLLAKAQVRLAGEVAFAFVGDEESGETGTGVSAGIQAYLAQVANNEIPKPDFAVYVEPTQLQVFTSQIGFFIAEIVVTGKAAYFGKPQDGVDAIKAMHSIQSAIWNHSHQLEQVGEHPLVGRAGALLTQISGGGYIAVPEKCSLALIRKLLPGEKLDDAVASFSREVDQTKVDPGISIEITYPAGRDHPCGGTPAEIDPELPAVAKLQQAIAATSELPGQIGGAPYWSEMPFLIDRAGCPAVYCAPGDIAVAHTLEEHIAVDEYLAAARAFALFIANYCGTLN